MVVIQLLEVIKNPTKQTAIYRAKPHLQAGGESLSVNLSLLQLWPFIS